MKTLNFSPTLENMDAATAFVEASLQSEGCPAPIVMKMCVAADELISNVARYSGATRARIDCGVRDGAALMILWDDGAAYDPTAQATPDTTLGAAEREIGGLGIHMVRKLMSALSYERKDGWNALSVRRDLN